MTIHSENKDAMHSQSPLSLYDLGYNNTLENFRIENQLESFICARVVSEHKERYHLKTPEGYFEAEIVGNLRYTAASRMDFPAVGDWVACSPYGEDKLLIHKVYKRNSLIKRKAVGKFNEEQIIAANIDFGLIVQSVDRDFNLNRIERYMAICYEAAVIPILILSKIDLINTAELDALLKTVKERLPNVNLIPLSNQDQTGIDLLLKAIEKGKTYALLGSSGVGKSSLINSLSAEAKMKTAAIGEKNNRGKHVTTHRELILLKHGGILIDNPGMRELGMGEMTDGLEQTFDTIAALSSSCKYHDCKHIHESSCAVLEALNTGDLDKALYRNYIKLLKEKAHFEQDNAEKRKRGKAFSKMVKRLKKE